MDIFMPIRTTTSPFQTVFSHFFQSSDVVNPKAPIVKSVIQELAISTDGFQYLSLILYRTLPQFGGPHPKLTDEMKKLTIISGETLAEFHERAVDINNSIVFSKITISNTMFF